MERNQDAFDEKEPHRRESRDRVRLCTKHRVHSI